MKTLIVYSKDSFYKYQDLYLLHNFYVDEDKTIVVSRIELTTGEEREYGRFKDEEWDHFVVEEEDDE